MLRVYARYFIPIQVLNSIFLQLFYCKGCMLKSETDGPVLYFFSFRISYAAQGLPSSGIDLNEMEEERLSCLPEIGPFLLVLSFCDLTHLLT